MGAIDLIKDVARLKKFMLDGIEVQVFASIPNHCDHVPIPILPDISGKKGSLCLYLG